MQNLKDTNRLVTLHSALSLVTLPSAVIYLIFALKEGHAPALLSLSISQQSWGHLDLHILIPQGLLNVVLGKLIGHIANADLKFLLVELSLGVIVPLRLILVLVALTGVVLFIPVEPAGTLRLLSSSDFLF